MKSDNERIEAFLKGVVLPEYESDGHARDNCAPRYCLASKPVASAEGPPTGGKPPHFCWAAGGRNSGDGNHYSSTSLLLLWQSEGWLSLFQHNAGELGTNHVDSIGIIVPGDLDAAGIEQKSRDLEEIDAFADNATPANCFVSLTPK
jgi:hypothetical protein